MPDYIDDLPATLAEAFRRLSRGVADRRAAFHTPTLATIGADGAPNSRTLVLRGFDAKTRQIRLHTDRRAEKYAEIAAEPRVALHFYDAASKLQLRLKGRATPHHDDDVAAQAWADTTPMGRLLYSITPAPGSITLQPVPAPDGARDGRDNFSVIMVRFDRLEWLLLSSQGHRRASFVWQDDALNAEWLVP